MEITISNATSHLFSLLALCALMASPTAAQAVDFCGTDGDYEPAAETLRTLELPNFGIAVEIPSNYRAMLRQNGEVEILHPDDFAMLQCLAQGGAGAHGYYSETIQLVTPDPDLSLREQAIWSVGYGFDENDNRIPAYADIVEYNQGDLSGYIVQSLSGYAVTFLGTYPGSRQLLEVSAGCDCSVEIEDVTEVLSRIMLLE